MISSLHSNIHVISLGIMESFSALSSPEVEVAAVDAHLKRLVTVLREKGQLVGATPRQGSTDTNADMTFATYSFQWLEVCR